MGKVMYEIVSHPQTQVAKIVLQVFT